MKVFKFNTTDEFETLFTNSDKKVTDAVVEAIEEALEEKKEKADLFRISFKEADFDYEITLPKSEWKTALQGCLNHYEELELTDECIDTWKLMEQVKTF